MKKSLPPPYFDRVTQTWEYARVGKLGGDGSPEQPITHYDWDPDADSDVKATLKSGKLGEDFYGFNHPNQFTGHFDDSGKFIGDEGHGDTQESFIKSMHNPTYFNGHSSDEKKAK